MPTSTAEGFRPSTFKFLRELAANNNRDWFQAHKPRYESEVLEPALGFVQAMAPRLERISAHFMAVPKRTGGSLMRVYRDTRFAHDKTPYKINIGIQFRHERGKDVHAPGFYVHLEPTACFVGVGIWHPGSEPLAAIRNRIAQRPAEWQRVINSKAFREQLALSGDRLKRPPRGFAPDAEHIEDLKRKDFIAIGELSEKNVLAPDLTARVATRFRAGKPLMAFLCTALELAF